MLIVTT